MRKIRPEHRAVIYITTLLHDIAKGRPEDHSIAGAKVARRLCPRLGFNAADTETGRLADRAASDDVDGGAVARPLRPQDHREFRRRGAVGRADEAADHPDHRRYPRRRSRGLERLEGAAAAHAVLRDRAGADRRLLRGQPRPAHRGGAGGIPRRLHRMAGAGAQRLYRAGTIRPTGSRSNCRARSATPASCAPANRPATSSRSMSASTRRAASPN